MIKVFRFGCRALQRLKDRPEAEEHIACGKHRGKQVHSLALLARLVIVMPPPKDIVHRELSGRMARIVEPPETLSPTFTETLASVLKTRSQRDPNLMRPTRCPRSRRSPTL